MEKTILVVGGAGYIGSHMVKTLLANRYRPVVYDNLVAGYRDAVKDCEFIQGDLDDMDTLDKLFQRIPFDAVMHFASYIQVADSMLHPQKYYLNNVSNTLRLLQVMRERKVNYFIFSSSAAVYGAPLYTPIDENHPRNPINPYGRTKMMVEDILQDYDRAYQLRSISLRYFNAAGAYPDGSIGERHDPETHLIPLVLRVAAGRQSIMKVYGNDYQTPDGTCVRDYIHVCDLCDAHQLALELLWTQHRSNLFNLGNGQGFSVKQVIEKASQITGKDIPMVIEPRRIGDPPILVASSERAQKELNWKPKYSRLDDIIAHAWQWEQKRIHQ